jgi:hypothetical protein
MNQVAQNQMRLYDLPSKLLCRVLNVELKVSPCPSPLRFPSLFLAPNYVLSGPLPLISASCDVNFDRRSRTPTRSTRRSCSCQSRK